MISIPNNYGITTASQSDSVVLASDHNDVPINLSSTKFIFSPTTGGNSSVTQLASGASFTGTIESILSQQAYSILFFSDQNSIITINQFIDLAGNKKISAVSYNYTASSTNFSRSGVANGNYFQVIVQNTGGSTTTALQLDTAYGTIPSSTPLGNSPAAINEINGSALNIGQQSQSNSLPIVAASDDYIVGQSAQSALINNILTPVAGSASLDVGIYRSFAVQIASTAVSGVVVFEGSNDNTNFQTIPVYNQASATRTALTTITLASNTFIIYEGSCTFRYMRLRISTATSGTIQAFSTFSQAPFASGIQAVGNGVAANFLTTVSGTVTANNNAGTAAHSAATSGNPVYVAGKVVPTTIATSDATLIAGDTAGLPVTTGQQVAVKDFATSELDYNFNISTLSTTVTVQTVIPSSGTASIRNYIRSIRLSNDTLGTAGALWILDSSLTVSSIAITAGLVTTSSVHDLKIGDSIVFTALASGTGVSTITQYYVTAIGSTTTFNFSATLGGSNIVPSVAYTSSTMYRILDVIRLQTTASNNIMINYNQPIRCIANTVTSILIPTSLTSGNVYLSINGYRGF